MKRKLKGYNFKKYTLATVALILTMLIGAIVVNAAGLNKSIEVGEKNPDASLTTDNTNYKMFTGTVGELNLTVNPGKLNSVTSTENHVVIAINSSTSITQNMLDDQKKSAKEMIEYLSKDNSTSFSIINYNVGSEVYPNNQDFKSKDVIAIKAYIDSISLSNNVKLGNNIGDAIRTSRIIFSKTKQGINKYMVFLTGSAPSAFSHSKIWWTDTKIFDRQSVPYDKYSCFTWKQENTEKLSDGATWSFIEEVNDQNFSTNKTAMDLAQYEDGVNDYKGFAQKYADNMAIAFAKNTANVRTFFLGYNADIKGIATKAGVKDSDYYYVRSGRDIKAVYKKINSIIRFSGYEGGKPVLKIRLPEGMYFYNEASTELNKWMQEGQINLEPFVFEKNSAGEYIGNTQAVKVKIRTTKDGMYAIDSKSDKAYLKLGYEDIRKVDRSSDLEKVITINSIKFNPEFTVNDSKNFKQTILDVYNPYKFSYTVKGENFDLLENADAVKEKKVVLVVYGLGVVDENIKKNIQKILDGHTSVAIVNYKERAEVVKLEGNSFFSTDAKKISDAIEKISPTPKGTTQVASKTIPPTTNSNIGDGIRVATALLKDGDETKNIVVIGNNEATNSSKDANGNRILDLDTDINISLTSEDEDEALVYGREIAKVLRARTDLNINLYGIALNGTSAKNDIPTDLESIVKSGSGEMIQPEDLSTKVTADLAATGELVPSYLNSNISIVETNDSYDRNVTVMYKYDGKSKLIGSTVTKDLNLIFKEEGIYTIHKITKNEEGKISNDGNSLNIVFKLASNGEYYAKDPITLDVKDNCKIRSGLYTNKKDQIIDLEKYSDLIIKGTEIANKGEKSINLAANNYFQGVTSIDVVGGSKYKFLLQYKSSDAVSLKDSTFSLYKIGIDNKVSFVKNIELGKFDLLGDDNTPTTSKDRYLITYSGRINSKVGSVIEIKSRIVPSYEATPIDAYDVRTTTIKINVANVPDLF